MDRLPSKLSWRKCKIHTRHFWINCGRKGQAGFHFHNVTNTQIKIFVVIHEHIFWLNVRESLGLKDRIWLKHRNWALRPVMSMWLEAHVAFLCCITMFIILKLSFHTQSSPLFCCVSICSHPSRQKGSRSQISHSDPNNNSGGIISHHFQKLCRSPCRLFPLSFFELLAWNLLYAPDAHKQKTYSTETPTLFKLLIVRCSVICGFSLGE